MHLLSADLTTLLCFSTVHIVGSFYLNFLRLLQYYSLLQSTTLYYKVLLRPKRRQNDVHPVLLRTTKYYSSTASYYKVLLLLQSTTPCTTPYYKVLFCTTKYYFDRNDVRTTSIQYYSVLQSTTPVLQSTTPALLRTTKYYSVLQSITPVLQSTTPALLRTRQSTTPVLQSTTLYCKVLLQYYSVLQSTTPVLLRPKRRQNDVHPVLLRTTKYYSSTTKYYPVLQSTTPVLLRTTNVLQSITPYYRVLLQYYSVLQSSTKASKTSISCEASSTFQGTSFQNEHFVRDFLNFSKNKLLKHHEEWLGRNTIGSPVKGRDFVDLGCDPKKEYMLSFRVIAMGDTNAVDLAQETHLQILQDAGCMRADETVAFKKRLPAKPTWEGLYIDDHVVTQIVPKRKIRGKEQRFRDEEIVEASRDQYRSLGIPTSSKKRFTKLHDFVSWGTSVCSQSGRVVGTPLVKLKQLSHLITEVCKLG